jgi:MFS family permease
LGDSVDPQPEVKPGRLRRFASGRFPALASRDFRLLWLGQGISAIGSMMQGAALNWQIYDLTGSYVALGLTGLFRVGPIVLLSLIGGTVADAWDRRKVMLTTQTVLALTAATLGLLTWLHQLTVVWIYALTMVSAGATAFDNPSRQSLIPRLLPRHDLPNGLSMMSVSFRTATIVGPAVAGLLIDRGGLGITYLLNALSFLAVIAALLLISPPAPEAVETSGETAKPVVSFQALTEGLRFVMTTPILVTTIWLDFLATFFSSANALLPVFAKDILHVGARGYGLLASAEAAGALAAGMVISFSRPIQKQGMAMLWAVMCYGFATVIFGASRWYWLSWLALAAVGASDGVSTILRQTIRQLVTPDHLRGRMTSVNMIFFMGGPQLGELEAGLAAKWLGAPLSVVVGGVCCLVTTAWVTLNSPMLRNYRLEGKTAVPVG